MTGTLFLLSEQALPPSQMRRPHETRPWTEVHGPRELLGRS